MILMMLIQLGSGISTIGYRNGAEEALKNALTGAGLKVRVFQVLAGTNLGVPGTHYSLCAFIDLPLGTDSKARLEQVLGDVVSKTPGFKNEDRYFLIATPTEFPIF